MPRFTVIQVGADRLDSTLPLVRMAAPLTSARQWRCYVDALSTSGGGLLAAFARDERPHGIAAYRIEDDLAQGRTLRVEPMVTFEINRSGPARAALCEALERIARAQGCVCLKIATGSRGFADPQGTKAEAWAPLGFELGSVSLVKRLAPLDRLIASQNLG